MKAVAQVLTFRELDAIRGALLDDMARTDLPIDTEPMKEALKKVDRVIDKTEYSKKPCNAYALVPLYIRSNNKE